MSKEIIIITAMIIATIIMVLKYFLEKQLKNAIFKKRMQRVHYIEKLVKDKKLSFEIINMDDESKRIEKTDNNNGLIIDKKLYDDKNSLFLKKDDKIYVIGKKEDFIIGLIGRNIN